MIESNLLPTERTCIDCDLFGPPKELKPLTMWYREPAHETAYRVLPDPHFKYDLLCASAIFLSQCAVQLIALQSNIALIGSLSASVVAIGVFLYLCHSHMGESQSTGSKGAAHAIVNSRALRMAIFVLTTALISACAVFSVVSIRPLARDPIPIIIGH